jgi:hypothetical protein
MVIRVGFLFALTLSGGLHASQITVVLSIYVRGVKMTLNPPQVSARAGADGEYQESVRDGV